MKATLGDVAYAICVLVSRYSRIIADWELSGLPMITKKVHAGPSFAEVDERLLQIRPASEDEHIIGALAVVVSGGAHPRPMAHVLLCPGGHPRCRPGFYPAFRPEEDERQPLIDQVRIVRS